MLKKEETLQFRKELEERKQIESRKLSEDDVDLLGSQLIEETGEILHDSRKNNKGLQRVIVKRNTKVDGN